MHCFKLESASDFELQSNMHTYVYAHFTYVYTVLACLH